MKRKKRYKLKRSPIRRKGKANLGVSYASPDIFEIVRCQGCDFMYFGGQSVTQNEMFMIIKLDVGN